MKVEIEVQDLKGLSELDKKDELVEKAGLIIDKLKKKMMSRFSGLSLVLTNMTFIPVKEDIQLETDGKHFFYNPDYLIKEYRHRKMTLFEYRCMHIIVHGLLSHFDMAQEYVNEPLMHILMDIEVSNFLSKLDIYNPYRVTCSEDDWYDYDSGEISLLKDFRNAKRNVRYRKYLYSKRKEYWIDDYKVWNRDKKYHYMVDIPESQGSCMNRGDLFKGKSGVSWKTMSSLMFGADCDKKSMLSKLNRGKNEQGRGHGDEADEEYEKVRMNKKAANDYMSVLKKFFRFKERCKEDIDTIDKALYTWGLSTYGNVAFIENEEESEQITLGTVVIAIDTSGSCEGEIMEQFLADTRAIFDSMLNLDFKGFVVVQCDAQIHDIKTFKNIRQLKASMLNTDEEDVYGFGGTSFIPVFEHIEEMKKKGQKVDCLIYFSDGMGEFPDKKPDVPTFFVVPVEDESVDIDEELPEWVKVLKMTINM